MVIALAGINPWKDGYLQINIITWRKKMFFRLLRGIKNGHWTPLNKYRQTGTKGGGAGDFSLFLQVDRENSCERKEEGLFFAKYPMVMLFATSSSCALVISNEGNKIGQKEGLCYAPAPGFGKKLCVATTEAANTPEGHIPSPQSPVLGSTVAWGYVGMKSVQCARINHHCRGWKIALINTPLNERLTSSLKTEPD